MTMKLPKSVLTLGVIGVVALSGYALSLAAPKMGGTAIALNASSVSPADEARMKATAALNAQLDNFAKDTNQSLAPLTEEQKKALLPEEAKAYSDFVDKAASGQFKFHPTLTMPEIKAPALDCLDDMEESNKQKPSASK